MWACRPRGSVTAKRGWMVRVLQAGTALRLRASLRPGTVVLTDEHGDLALHELAGHVELMARSGRSQRHAPRLSELPADAPLRQVLATALASGAHLEMRSSGGTGIPRFLQHGPVTATQLRTLRDLAHRIGVRPRRPIATAFPGVHGLGLLVALGALSLGAPLVDLSHLPSGRKAALLHRSAPHLLVGSPIHLADLMHVDRERGGNRPLRIRRVISASAALPADLRADLARHWSARVHDVYGTIEAGPLTVDGRPLHKVRIRERDGLLIVRSPFTEGRALVTDRGTVDAKGRVMVAEPGAEGSDVGGSGGMVHAPRTVARLLASEPGVEAVRLRVVTDDSLGRHTVAELDLNEHAPEAMNPHGTRALVQDRLGAASVPREVVLHRP